MIAGVTKDVANAACFLNIKRINHIDSRFQARYSCYHSYLIADTHLDETTQFVVLPYRSHGTDLPDQRDSVVLLCIPWYFHHFLLTLAILE